MRTACYLWLLVGLIYASCLAQQPPSELARALRGRETDVETRQKLGKIAAVFRSYLRDVAETRFHVRSTITEYGADGRPDKTTRKTHKFHVEGVRVADEFHLHAGFKADRGTFWLQTIPDYVVFFDAGVISQADRNIGFVQFDNPVQDTNTLTVTYRSVRDCSAFERSEKKFMQWIPKTWCGEGAVTVDAATLLPIRTSFHAGGLPLIDGQKRLDDYCVEHEFQVVQVSGSGTRILPRTTIATFATEKGKIVVENEFALETQ